MPVEFSQQRIGDAVKKSDVKSLRMVFLVMVFSVVLLLAAVWFQMEPKITAGTTPAWFPVFQGMMLLFIAGLYVVAVWGPKLWLKPERLHQLILGAKRKNENDQDAILEMLSLTARMVLVLRVSILEAAALLGCVVLFVAAHFHLLFHNPLLWLNALPVLVLLIFVFLFFPTRMRIARFISTHILTRL